MRSKVSAKLTALFAGMLALAACSDNPDADLGDPAPPLYEVVSAEGEVEAWLFGTIHTLPRGTDWRTAEVRWVIEQADSLVVEIAGLDDRASMQAVFLDKASSPNQPLLDQRVEPGKADAVNALIDRVDRDKEDFRSIETWAAALILAQASSQGDPAFGVDRLVIREFEDREVIEFEGAEKQLSIFDQLPEKDQRDLLEGVIEETGTADTNPGKLRRAWLMNDSDVLEQATTNGIMADAELRQALLVDRNHDWIEQLIPTLDLDDRPLVAVGAAHLVGPDGLKALLEQAGYTIRPLH